MANINELTCVAHGLLGLKPQIVKDPIAKRGVTDSKICVVGLRNISCPFLGGSASGFRPRIRTLLLVVLFGSALGFA